MPEHEAAGGRNVYITAMEPHCGKNVVALGLMELLSARVERVGFFRPIVPSGAEHDTEIELIRRRYRLEAPYEAMYRCLPTRRAG